MSPEWSDTAETMSSREAAGNASCNTSAVRARLSKEDNSAEVAARSILWWW